MCKQATADICKPAGGWGGIYCKVASVFVCGELCYDDPDGWFCDWYDTCQICCQAAYGCESYCPAADFTAY